MKIPQNYVIIYGAFIKILTAECFLSPLKSDQASWVSDNVNKQSNFSKTKFDTHELWRQKVSSFSVSMKTRDQLELSHHYGSSGLRYSIHAPKLANGGVLEAL